MGVQRTERGKPPVWATTGDLTWTARGVGGDETGAGAPGGQVSFPEGAAQAAGSAAMKAEPTPQPTRRTESSEVCDGPRAAQHGKAGASGVATSGGDTVLTASQGNGPASASASTPPKDSESLVPLVHAPCVWQALTRVRKNKEAAWSPSPASQEAMDCLPRFLSGRNLTDNLPQPPTDLHRNAATTQPETATIGSFHSALEAALAYDSRVKELKGRRANRPLNFSKEKFGTAYEGCLVML